MKKRERRSLEAFGLSFLDCICCGFGAIILLLVLTKFAEPVLLEQTSDELEAIITTLEEQLVDLKGETRIVNDRLKSKEEQLSEVRDRVARLQGDLSRIEGRFSSSKDTASVSSIIEGQLAEARQRLTEEMKRLQANQYRRAIDDTTVGGVPVDSEYIIFIIDTSGSMFNYGWPMVLRKVEETLAVYPQVKGIQVMNDMGNYMFTRYSGKWIPDSPARRKAIVNTLKTWNPFSNSSPVEGITKAIQTFYEPGKKISLYVFGDEFTGNSIENVIRTVDLINKEDARGNRLVRIHAVGFPVMFAQAQNLQYTGLRFATLMRALCDRNGGTFVGLNTFRP
jgi:hypothetical protein